jgi:hypothetical protein
LLVELFFGLLLAGALAPLTLFVLPETAQGPAALWVVAIGSILVVMGISRKIRRRG